MTIEELQVLCDEQLSIKTEELVTTGEVVQNFDLLLPDNTVHGLWMDPRLFENERTKDLVASLVKQAIEETQAIAVMHYCDSWVRESTDKAVLDRIKTGELDPYTASDLGLMTKREAIVVILQTPIYTFLAHQYYRHEGETIVLEERTQDESKGYRTIGRFANFFPPIPAGKPS